MKTSGFRVPRFYRVLAEKEIRFPRTTINRWLSLVYKLTEEDLKVESEVLIRSGRKQDLDFLLGCEDSADPGRHILLQDIKFWDQYGFRCLYTGYLNGDAHPFCLVYVIDDSDNHRFKLMEYGDIYRPLNSDTVQIEGGYIRKDRRGKDYFLKFQQKLNKILYQKGKKIVYGHVAVNENKIPAFQWASAVGFVPDHFISRVIINLPFFTSKVFVHHEIKKSDRKRFLFSFFGAANVTKRNRSSTAMS